MGKIPWRSARQPTPVFLFGESPWTEEPGGLQSMGSSRVRNNWVSKHTSGSNNTEGWWSYSSLGLKSNSSLARLKSRYCGGLREGCSPFWRLWGRICFLLFPTFLKPLVFFGTWTLPPSLAPQRKLVKSFSSCTSLTFSPASPLLLLRILLTTLDPPRIQDTFLPLFGSPGYQPIFHLQCKFPFIMEPNIHPSEIRA